MNECKQMCPMRGVRDLPDAHGACAFKGCARMTPGAL
jgi:hypothetical protein